MTSPFTCRSSQVYHGLVFDSVSVDDILGFSGFDFSFVCVDAYTRRCGLREKEVKPPTTSQIEIGFLISV